MAITFNPNGTVTGISVGGLPDGIVDTDMLANSAVSPAKRGTASILQIVQNITHTRFATTSGTFVASNLAVTITPLKAGSKILINIIGLVNTNGTNHRLFTDVYRSVAGGTAAGIAPMGSSGTTGANNNEGFFGSIRADNSRMQAPMNLQYLDTPSYSLGNSIVYTLYARSGTGDTVEVPGSNQQEPAINMATEIAS